MNQRLHQLCHDVVDGKPDAEVALCRYVVCDMPVNEPPLSEIPVSAHEDDAVSRLMGMGVLKSEVTDVSIRYAD